QRLGHRRRGGLARTETAVLLRNLHGQQAKLPCFGHLLPRELVVEPLEALEIGHDLALDEGAGGGLEQPQLVVEALGYEDGFGRSLLDEEGAAGGRAERRALLLDHARSSTRGRRVGARRRRV